jgi:hypothetical protein
LLAAREKPEVAIITAVDLTGNFGFVTAEPDVVLHRETWRREQGAESLQYRRIAKQYSGQS